MKDESVEKIVWEIRDASGKVIRSGAAIRHDDGRIEFLDGAVTKREGEILVVVMENVCDTSS